MREVLANLLAGARPGILVEGRSDELEAQARVYDDLVHELSVLKSKLESRGAHLGILQLQDLTALMEEIDQEVDAETP